VFDGRRHEFLDICCVRPDLNDVFDDLLAYILEQSDAVDRPAMMALTAVDRWRDLLRARASGGLSERDERGLFGELWTFFLVGHVTNPLPTASWRGPFHEPHDIVLPGGWFEVKTIGPTSQDIRVHGLEQLAREDERPGTLVVVEVVSVTSGTSVDDLVREVTTLADSSDQLERALLSVGWVAGHDSGRRFEVSAVLCLPTEHVPRIVPSSITGGVPDGVRLVEYSVDLAPIRAMARQGEGAVLDAIRAAT
jgi:hypothetical protein